MLGAIIGAAVGLISSKLSSDSTKKAANKAADAQVQAARENNALATQFRAENTANFTPTLNSGTRANALLDSFLYGTPSAAPQPFGAPANDQGMGVVNGGMPMNDGGGGNGIAASMLSQQEFMPDYSVGQTAVNGRGARNLALARAQASMPGVQTPPVMTAAPQSPVAAQPTNALSGYDQFVASPYYQTPLQEGIRARNMGYAARGTLQSGAALKELDRFGQNYGAGRMDEYLGLAERQANRGVTGASAIAGVGQNALSAMTANNQSGADAVANAALLRAQANNALYGSFAGIAGNLAGSFGSSFGGFGK